MTSALARPHAIRLTCMPSSAVDVVVVTYNPGDTITTFLQSAVGAQGVQSVTVVDNASGDDVAQRAAADAGAGFVQTGRNAGYGAAANIGALHRVGGLDPGVQRGHRARAGRRSAASAAGWCSRTMRSVRSARASKRSTAPRIRQLDRCPRSSWARGMQLFGKGWPHNPWTRRYRLDLHPLGGEVDAGWLSGSCFLVRRSVWEQLGGFDERYFMFFEDVDLGRRIGLAGYRQVWTPRAVVTHLGGHSYRSDPAPMLKAHHDSARLYLASVYPHWWQAPVRAVTAAGLAARERAEVVAARRKLATRAD